MGVRGCNAWHPMSEQRLSHLVVDAEALEPGCKAVPQIMEMKVLDFCQLTYTRPVLLEGSDIIPAAEHPAVSDRREGVVERPKCRWIQGQPSRGSLQARMAWWQDEPPTICLFPDPRALPLP